MNAVADVPIKGASAIPVRIVPVFRIVESNLTECAGPRVKALIQSDGKPNALFPFIRFRAVATGKR